MQNPDVTNRDQKNNMNTAESSNTIEFKQLASLGDQKYPSFELRHILAILREQGNEAWCSNLIEQLDLQQQLQEDFIPSHTALSGLKEVVNNHFYIGLGAKVAERYKLEDFGGLGLALRHSPSLYDALTISFSYYELIGSFTDLTLIQDGDHYTNRLINVSALDEQLVHFLFELTISGMASIGQTIAQREIPVQIIRFRLALSDSQKQYFAQKFNCEIEDKAQFNEWVLELNELKQNIDRARDEKETLNESIESLNLLMNTLRDEFALVEKFHRLVLNNDEDFPNSKELADAMFMSERTFRRKLNKIGLNYNLLMGKIRCQIAIAMLQAGIHTNEDIAFELGFSDAANFCNAFKKWTGNTPNFYRP